MRIAYICSLLLVDKNVIIWLNNFLDFPLLLYHAYIFGRVCPKNVISEHFCAFNVCTYYKSVHFYLTCSWALLSVTIGFQNDFLKAWKDYKLTYLEQTGF